MTPYIKDENVRQCIASWLKTLNNPDLRELKVMIGDFDHGGVCMYDAYFAVKDPITRCELVFFNIEVDEGFWKSVKEQQNNRMYCMATIEALIGDIK